MSRPANTSPFARTTPLANVRREQVQSGDPLLDFGPLSTTNPQSESSSVNNLPPPPPVSVTPTVKVQELVANPFRPISVQDSVEQLSDLLFKSCRIQPHHIELQDGDLKVLYHCVASKSWQHAVNVSAKLLSHESSLSEQENRLVSILRYESLFHLKMYDDLNTELNNSLQSHNKLIASKENSSFEILNFLATLQILQSEVKLMTGHGLEALELLKLTNHWVETNLSSYLNFQIYWQWQIKCHEVNSNIRSRNWKGALKLLRDMMLLIDRYLLDSKNEDETGLLLKVKIILLLRSSKLLLQIGSVKASTQHVLHASQIADESKQLDDPYISSLLKLSHGLSQFAEEKFEAALETFSSVLDFDYTQNQPFALMLEGEFSRGMAVWAVFVIGKEECPKAAALNNYAICCLYLKRNLTAIKKMEELITDDPLRFMTDAVVFNLCTMYDLSFAPDSSTSKKKALQKLATKYSINDPILHWRSFRLN